MSRQNGASLPGERAHRRKTRRRSLEARATCHASKTASLSPLPPCAAAASCGWPVHSPLHANRCATAIKGHDVATGYSASPCMMHPQPCIGLSGLDSASAAAAVNLFITHRCRIRGGNARQTAVQPCSRAAASWSRVSRGADGCDNYFALFRVVEFRSARAVRPTLRYTPPDACMTIY